MESRPIPIGHDRVKAAGVIRTPAAFNFAIILIIGCAGPRRIS